MIVICMSVSNVIGGAYVITASGDTSRHHQYTHRVPALPRANKIGPNANGRINPCRLHWVCDRDGPVASDLD